MGKKVKIKKKKSGVKIREVGKRVEIKKTKESDESKKISGKFLKTSEKKDFQDFIEEDIDLRSNPSLEKIAISGNPAGIEVVPTNQNVNNDENQIDYGGKKVDYSPINENPRANLIVDDVNRGIKEASSDYSVAVREEIEKAKKLLVDTSGEFRNESSDYSVAVREEIEKAKKLLVDTSGEFRNEGKNISEMESSHVDIETEVQGKKYLVKGDYK